MTRMSGAIALMTWRPGMSFSTASANARAASRESRYAHSSFASVPGSSSMGGRSSSKKATGATPLMRSATAW